MMRLFVTACVLIGASLADKAALLIIDVQDCFLKGGNLEVKNGNDVIDVINTIRRDYKSAFSLVVFSLDWHCTDHVSFASQHNGHSPYDVINLQYDQDGNLCYGNSVPASYPHAHACSKVEYNISQVLWPDHCIKDVTSGGASSNLDSSLIRKKKDILIKKGKNCGIDAYSVFYDNGGFRQTQLDSILKEHSIDSVYVTGLAFDYCVYYTSLDAVKLGYKTFIIADAARGVSPDTTAAAVADMAKKGVNVIQSTAIGTFLQVNKASCMSYNAWISIFAAFFPSFYWLFNFYIE